MSGLFSCLASSWSIGKVFWEARWVSTLQVAPFTGGFIRKTSRQTRSVLLTRSETDARSPKDTITTPDNLATDRTVICESHRRRKFIWCHVLGLKCFLFEIRTRGFVPPAVGHTHLDLNLSLEPFLFRTTWLCVHDLHFQTPVSLCVRPSSKICHDPMTGGQFRTTEQIYCLFQQISSEFNY